MDMWNEPPGDGKWGRPHGDEEPQQRYLGLSATQFNLAFFAAVGAIALAVFLYLGGAGAVQDFFGGGEDDTAFGGARSWLERTFNDRIFVIAFVSNARASTMVR